MTAESRLPERIGLTGLSRAGDTWSVRIEPFNSNFGGSIYGGAALGAAVEMLESVTGSRVRSATARFLRAPGIGSELILSHSAAFVGRRSSHMTVTATYGDQIAFEVTAVVGRGNPAAGISGQWAEMPAVPLPADCPAVPDRPEHARNAAGQADRRPARAGNGGRAPGRSSVWTRLKVGGTSTPAGLAWIADSIASGLSQSVGPLALATSLDNTIRYAAAAQSEWVLVDVHAHASADGYAYGDVHLFSESGTLLATGSQTCIARTRAADPAVLRRRLPRLLPPILRGLATGLVEGATSREYLDRGGRARRGAALAVRKEMDRMTAQYLDPVAGLVRPRPGDRTGPGPLLAGEPGQRRSQLFELVNPPAKSAVGLTITWSAPAARCSRTLAAIAAEPRIRPATSSLSGPSSCLAWAVNSGGTMAGIAPSAISPDSASILGPFAPMIFG